MGGKLKSVAVAILVFELFATVFCAGYLVYKHAPLITSILIVLGAGLAAFLQFILLYCIGETEDECNSILSGVNEMQKRIENLEKEIYSMNNDKIKVVYKSPESTQKIKIHSGNAAKNGVDAVAPLKSSEEDYIYCPNCGLKQKSSRTVCWKCSTKFI